MHAQRCRLLSRFYEAFFGLCSGSYGAPGAGGALACADPAVEIGYAYVTNKMGVKIDGDPREVALRNTLMKIIG